MGLCGLWKDTWQGAPSQMIPTALTKTERATLSGKMSLIF